jgi:hypothetical protein
MGGGWSYHYAGDLLSFAAGLSRQRRRIFFGPIAEWIGENKPRIGSGRTCGHASSVCPQEIDLERWCISVISSSVNRRAVYFRNRYHQRGVRHRQPHPRISHHAAPTLLEEPNSKSSPTASLLVNIRLPAEDLYTHTGTHPYIHKSDNPSGEIKLTTGCFEN